MLRPVPACWTRWFQVGPCFVDEMVAGHYGSLGDTESGSQFQLHSGAPASGRGGKEEWLVGCWSPHFPGSDQGRTAKTQSDITANHCFLFFSLWTNSHTPFRYYYRQHYGFGKDIPNTQIILLQFHYYARKKIASKAHPLLMQGVLPLGSFIFQETEHKQISKVPLNFSRVLI